MTKHSTMSEWRIDSQIYPLSYWHLLIASLWLMVFFLLMLLAELLWWQWLIMVGVMVLTLVVRYLGKRPVVHITQPIIDGSYPPACWFVYLTKDKQAWQGYLTSSYNSRYLVVLHFDIVHPVMTRLSVPIWRDQVERKEWRKLQVFSRLEG